MGSEVPEAEGEQTVSSAIDGHPIYLRHSRHAVSADKNLRVPLRTEVAKIALVAELMLSLSRASMAAWLLGFMGIVSIAALRALAVITRQDRRDVMM